MYKKLELRTSLTSKACVQCLLIHKGKKIALSPNQYRMLEIKDKTKNKNCYKLLNKKNKGSKTMNDKTALIKLLEIENQSR